MKLLSLSDHHTGGAAVAAKRLNATLRDHLNDAISHSTGYSDPDGALLRFPSNLSIERIAQKCSPLPAKVLRQWNASQALRSLLKRVSPDIVHFHNIHGIAGWNLTLVEKALRYAPVVWILHDQWALTGGLTYKVQTESNIETTSAKSLYGKINPTEVRRLLKLALAFQNHFRIVCPSQWLEHEAIKIGLPADSVANIPNSLDLNEFSTCEPNTARKRLGLPDDGTPTALVVSVDTKDPRKGGFLLEQALEKLDLPLRVLVAGSAPLTNQNPNIDWRYLGQFKKSEDLVNTYQAADLLIHPALIDNLPNVVVESLACGTPVVAFHTGGLPDMVKPGRTGWLAESISPVALAQTITGALGDLKTCSLRESARIFAEDLFCPRKQAKAFEMLHVEIMQQQGK